MMAEGMEAEIRQEIQLPSGQGVPDIWQEIFGYLTDPDFQNLLLASPDYFELLLNDRKCALLLPQVLQVLDRRDYIVKSTTLECRLLSKCVKSSIDKWILDRNPCLENLDGWDHDRWDSKHDPLHCWNPLRRQNEVPNTKAILGGYVSFQLLVGFHGEEAQQLQNFRLLLAHFGSQIRYFQLSVVGPLVQCLELLREILEQMPNLRALDISDYIPDGTTSHGFNLSTLPNLSHLSTLRIERLHSTDFVNVLLAKYGTQLKKVCLASLSRIQFTRLICGFKNLTQVSLPRMGDVHEVQEYLNPRREWLQRLETLSVHVSARSIEPILAEVFVALENCFGRWSKLQNLNLYLHDPLASMHTYSGTTLPLRLFLPRLKRLWISGGCYRLLPIDFILGMRETLEEFTLDMRFHHTSRANVDGQVTPRLLDRMRDSNLWNEMTKLQRITIRWGFPPGELATDRSIEQWKFTVTRDGRRRSSLLMNKGSDGMQCRRDG